MTVLQVDGLSVNFGGVVAVNDVSFHLDEGQILGVIGPNGAGKTTMFDAISGFAPSSGRVTLAGKVISDLSPEKRSKQRLGRSFQDAKLFPSLTVRETLAIAFERHMRRQGIVSSALRMPWIHKAEKHVNERVEDLIGVMGLTAFRDKFVSELSTGSRRIVDLAVILAHDPKVLLLDEPSSGIAQREAEALGPLLLRIREQTGCSILVIEHDMPLIRAVSDELLALETGAVLMKGHPDEVLDDPRLIDAYLGTDRAVVERSGTRSTVPEVVASTNGHATKPEGPDTADAKKIVVKRAAVKRAPAKKTAAKKTAAKKAAKKKTATKKTATKKTAAKKTATKRAPAKRAAPNKVATKRAPVKRAPAKKAVAKRAPVKKTAKRSSTH